MASSVELPDVIAEAMHRRGRYTPRRILNNNYIAEAHASRGRRRKKPSRTCSPTSPKPKHRRKVGAPRGNRNALKSGLYTGEMKSLRLQVRLRLASLRLATAQAKLLAVQLGR